MNKTKLKCDELLTSLDIYLQAKNAAELDQASDMVDAVGEEEEEGKPAAVSGKPAAAATTDKAETKEEPAIASAEESAAAPTAKAEKDEEPTDAPAEEPAAAPLGTDGVVAADPDPIPTAILDPFAALLEAAAPEAWVSFTEAAASSVDVDRFAAEVFESSLPALPSAPALAPTSELPSPVDHHLAALLHYCEECKDTEKLPATIRCKDCPKEIQFLCDTHTKKQHKSKMRSKHERYRIIRPKLCLHCEKGVITIRCFDCPEGETLFCHGCFNEYHGGEMTSKHRVEKI